MSSEARKPGSAREPTVEQLRDDIDSGRTQDKVSAGDPAAAPLGTDDEAAGMPPEPERVALARANETRRGSRPRAHGARPVQAFAIGLIAILAMVLAAAFLI